MVQAAEQPTGFSPARVLIGSLIGGAGLVILGFFLGTSQASAAEPAPTPPVHSVLGAVGGVVSDLDTTVGSVVGGVTHAASSVTQAVAPSVPAPVQDVVATVTAPVMDTLGSIADQAPVTSTVTPVVTAVDNVVNSIPLTNDLLGDDPVATVVTPVTDTVDDTVASVVDGVTTAVDPVTGTPIVTIPPVVPGTPGAPGVDGPGTPGVDAGGQPTSATPAAQSAGVDVASFLSGRADAHPLVGATPGARSVTLPGGVPATPGEPGGPMPAAPPAPTSGSGSGGAGAGAAAGATVPETFFAPLAARGGLPGGFGDDRIPASPVLDHDTSPD